MFNLACFDFSGWIRQLLQRNLKMLSFLYCLLLKLNQVHIRNSKTEVEFTAISKYGIRVEYLIMAYQWV